MNTLVPLVMTAILTASPTTQPQGEVILVPTTHMDIDFTRRPDAAMGRYGLFIQRAMEAIEREPDVRYSVQLASAVWRLLETQPELRAKLAGLVRSGHVEVACNWTNPHYSELGGETIIRQIAWTKSWLAQTLGIDVRIVDNGELADPTPQLAQVLARSGIDFFHTAKGSALAKTAGVNTGGTFWFVGLDGSRVLYNGENYNRSAEQLHERPWGWPAGKAGGLKALEASPTGKVRLFTDGGPGWDDELPRFDDLLTFVRGWNADPELSCKAMWRLGTYADLDTALRGELEAGLTLPTATGHTEHGELLYQRVWKLARDRALFESLMPQTQAVAAWCQWLGMDGIASDPTTEVWRTLLESCTHNWAYTDQQSRILEKGAASARTRLEGLNARVLGNLAAAAPAGATLVLNTLPHPRKELVRVGEDFRVVELPAMGWVTLKPGQGQAKDLRAEARVVENKHYRVSADAKSGLTSIYDKRRERELLRPVDGESVLTVCASYNEAMGAERFDYYRGQNGAGPEQLEALRGWFAKTDATMQPTSVTTRRAGDAVELVVRGRTGETDTCITVRLATQTDYVELELSSGPRPQPQMENLPEQLKAWVQGGPMYFATLELNVDDAADGRTSVPFGSIGLSSQVQQVVSNTGIFFSDAVGQAGAVGWVSAYNEAWHRPLEDLFAARLAQPHWTTLWDKRGAGITWCQFAPYANMFRDPRKPTKFYRSLWQGESTGGVYRWRLVSHDGDWRAVNAPRLAEEMNAPPIVLVGKGEAGRDLPAAVSFMELAADNLVFSTLQSTFDGRGFILRVYESQDRPAAANLKLGARLADWHTVRTDLLERPTDHAGRQTVAPFEIATFRLDHP